MKKIIFMSLVLSVVAVSCTVKKYGTREQDIVNQTIFTRPMVADVDVNVNKKIEGYAEDKMLDDAKSKARHDALTKSGADIIVDPVYSYEKPMYGKYKVTVQGYFGKYTAVKPMDIPDTTLWKTGLKSNVVNKAMDSGKKPIFNFGRK
ncbi:MAG: hypothetical protein KDC84_05150 [Crocinitomicaceae bacterium]|nr:hypothetical protein [Crocinitomicaceae bacterium]